VITTTISDARTHLSQLVKRAERGETVLITSGRERRPVARLEAVVPVAKKRLGVLETPGFVLSEQFFEPLPEDELKF
jgi:prevent-host-death family protein